MATKKQLILNPLSVLNKARDDEPLFILRASDSVASQTILDWMGESAKRGASGEKLGGASDVWQEFIRWQRKNPADVKVPD